MLIEQAKKLVEDSNKEQMEYNDTEYNSSIWKLAAKANQEDFKKFFKTEDK